MDPGLSHCSEHIVIEKYGILIYGGDVLARNPDWTHAED